MKSIQCFGDLRPYGIDCLTGEACGLGLRILCDVTEPGRKLLGKVFGIPDMKLAAPWNSKGVGSILLTHDMVTTIAIFALLEYGCREVYTVKDGTYGVEADDSPESVEEWCQYHRSRDVHPHRWAYRGTAGDRNVHVMSGRVG